MTNAHARPSMHSSAVQIPVKPKQETAHRHKPRHRADFKRKNSSSSNHHRARDAHSPDAIPPSVAALLAVTSIPPPNRRGSLRQRPSKETRMTVDSIVPRSQISEKDLSQELDDELNLPSLGRGSPMDVLLSPPEELEEYEASVTSESAFASALSTRTGSFESVPSLGCSPGTSTLPSIDSPITPRGRKFRQPRRSLEPVSSPGEKPEDPLSNHDIDQLDFRVFNPSPLSVEKKRSAVAIPLKSVFKSNLTASLRALRSAARSISSFTAASIPPEDFLTRSILTIDPRVPFTDERMPPVWEEEPSEAMRRYLNPTSSLRPEPRSTSPLRSYTASIQMRTYKVQRSKSPVSAMSRPATQPPYSNKSPAEVVFPPGPRQREMRENSDFIRIAVMEHLMRKQGKLDDQREGHARWLLPPRKATTKPYEIGPDGVPLRWVSTSLADG
ncbi:hypothetical protein DL770_007812 [Monosporascus sp. CRB-9-2]|nr:hypothetical protein DL770_007812 [Monosporascus sp. CRB-9-2]